MTHSEGWALSVKGSSSLSEAVYTYSSARNKASFWNRVFLFFLLPLKKEEAEDETDFVLRYLLPGLK